MGSVRVDRTLSQVAHFLLPNRRVALHQSEKTKLFSLLLMKMIKDECVDVVVGDRSAASRRMTLSVGSEINGRVSLEEFLYVDDNMDPRLTCGTYNRIVTTESD